VCSEAGVTLYPNIMSITGMVNVGTGVIAPGYGGGRPRHVLIVG
jgi:hypothetical protein